MVKNILSIDVEEIFHAEYVKKGAERKNYRSLVNIELILEILKVYDISATFFVVGEIIDKFPKILKIIEEQGHEVSFHGWSHKPLWELNEESFSFEVEKFLRIHPDCLGFRAPSFSLDERTLWALNILENRGFMYDSSLFPTKTPLYGVPKVPLVPYKLSKKNLTKENDQGIWEFPPLTYSFFGIRIPSAGGFYLRFIPALVRKSMKSRNLRGYPAIIYVHSWELDPETPRFPLGLFRSFITYHNIGKTTKFLNDLLSHFEFTSFKNYLADHESN